MTTKQQPPPAEVTIQIDGEGTELGKFNADGDPIISYDRQSDGWMLAHKTPTGTNCLQLDVHGSGPDSVTNAVTAAREHLHATKAAVAQGS
jgi:hypothetical protein